MREKYTFIDWRWIYRIAGNFRGRKFSRFNGKSVWNKFYDFYFREFKWTDLWISVVINYCGFYFRDSIYSPRNRENKNPAKISRYTVYIYGHCGVSNCWQALGITGFDTPKVELLYIEW